MTTRCNILIGKRLFYHESKEKENHVGEDLAYFLAHINAGVMLRWADTIDDVASSVADVGVPSRMTDVRGIDDHYRYQYDCWIDHTVDDIYIVTGEKGSLRLYHKPIEKSRKTWFGAIKERDPILTMTKNELIEACTRPEYEVLLPSIDVPPKDRLYVHMGTIDHRSAEDYGLRREIEYGDVDYDSQLMRVRNVKPRKFLRRWR